MKVLLIEGQPGSGKTELTKYLAQNIEEECVVIDECMQDEEIFGDYWENNKGPIEEMSEGFLKAWQGLIDKYHDSKAMYIFDNALLNQAKYLMALGATRETVRHFFRDVTGKLAQVEVRMVFLDGDSEIVIRRINALRKNGWGIRVAELLAAFPYQATRQRVGLDGMVSFFADAQELKRELMTECPFPYVTIDVTDAEWEKYQEQALGFGRHVAENPLH